MKTQAIIFSGMAGSGKSSLARAIASKYGLKYVCGGDILKEMAKEEGYKITGNDWWETADGIKFLSQRKKNFEFDKRLDKHMIAKAKKGGFAMTSWAIPWLGAPGIKIWVDVTREVRAKRILGRDGIPYTEALELVRTRDKENVALYKKMYGYTLGRDLDVFDLVLDANVKGVEELVKEIVGFLEKKNIQKNK
ncbi:cytidylate kinase family protein [archaeon]|nr:cytidylate kinase family protein [Nanoarchaeota archaeon]MBU4300914.1 cytidylate kinase family protein [Nanoarchaeota archaeon]MBU4451756.1 cytidylate kinase family protein [Nanoarchaeota archaeon]MCG2723261.1 cytidylate kinase family protein [archaeon]